MASPDEAERLPAASSEQPSPIRPRHRVRRRLIIIGGVLVVVLAAAYVGGSYWLSSVLLDPHRDLNKPNTQVQAATDSTVTFKKDKHTEAAGIYGLEWSDGHAVLGDVLSSDDTTVTREISEVTGALAAGTEVAVIATVWDGDPQSARDVAFENVVVPGPLGDYPAWQIPGSGSTWVLFVHGIDGDRAAALRVAPTLAESGLTSLIITYRNDVGAPASPDGLIHLGMTEWQDLEAAAAYAVDQGAENFVLYGESMGGSIVTRFLHESTYADRVVGMVLDAPVLNWAGVISNQASSLHLPFLAPPVRWWITQRADVDFAALNEIDQASAFSVPILLFQGLADPLVPPAESEAFAEGVPGGLVQYEPVADAGHIQSWNLGPDFYESTLSTFLQQFTR